MAEGIDLFEIAFGEAMSAVSQHANGAESLVRTTLEKWAIISKEDRLNKGELAQLKQLLTTFKSGLGACSTAMREVARRSTDNLLPLLAKGIRVLECGTFGISAHTLRTPRTSLLSHLERELECDG